MRKVRNDGDVDVGVVIRMRVAGEAVNPTILNVTTGEHMTINTTRLETLTGSGLVADDEIIISTIKGAKSVNILRNGVYTNILNCLDRYTDWISLATGLNTFLYTAESGADNLEFQIENRIVYMGV
jgi:hypothetical protein